MKSTGTSRSSRRVSGPGAGFGARLASTLMSQDTMSQRHEAENIVASLKDEEHTYLNDRKSLARRKLENASAKIDTVKSAGQSPREAIFEAGQIAREIKRASLEYATALRMEMNNVGAGHFEANDDEENGHEHIVHDAMENVGEMQALKDFRQHADDLAIYIDDIAQTLYTEDASDHFAHEAQRISKDMLSAVDFLGSVMREAGYSSLPTAVNIVV